MKLYEVFQCHFPFQAIETTRQSPTTRQFPYIIFNGQEHSESEAIISLLSKHFDIDNETGFSPEEWAISRAMCKLVDEDLSWYELNIARKAPRKPMSERTEEILVSSILC